MTIRGCKREETQVHFKVIGTIPNQISKGQGLGENPSDDFITKCNLWMIIKFYFFHLEMKNEIIDNS